MGHLRRIAVHVDEPDPGHFFWVLMEEGDDASQWKELESAGEPMKCGSTHCTLACGRLKATRQMSA